MSKKTSTARRRADQSKDDERSVLEIDRYNLEKEWTGQAALFYRYGIELAEARLEADGAKAELDVTKAELDASIREDPEAYDVVKVSETAISNVILQQPAYQLALDELNTATHKVRLLEAMTKALEHRKRALTDLVTLHISNYYAEPQVRKELKGAAKEAFEEEAKAHIRSRGRRRRSKDE